MLSSLNHIPYKPQLSSLQGPTSKIGPLIEFHVVFHLKPSPTPCPDPHIGEKGSQSLDFQGMRAADSKGPLPPPSPPHFSQLHANESASG
ncbi:hypothetical protein CDAR_240561 [Caerostris darwini]|uniref:Uncharacterized protein n=1 Tax=Caerostris darwini TaxID=1538125 RepID=A0AAV4PM47_9ARAC|nr:hypothetical protein CDAR_240561 [Caerostris darwini]